MKPERGFGQMLGRPLSGVVLVMSRCELDGLGLAFEIARRLVVSGHCSRLRVWSWQSWLSLGGAWLSGDPLTPGYRWTLTREMLIGLGSKVQPVLIQDPMRDELEKAASLRLGSSCVYVGNGSVYLGERSDAVLLDFRGDLDLKNDADVWKLRLLNEAAKKSGQTVVLVLDWFKSFGFGCRERSYAKLIMRVGMEHGIDLSSCAEVLVEFERTARIGPPVEWCRIMSRDGALRRSPAFVVEKDRETGRYRENPSEDECVAEY